MEKQCSHVLSIIKQTIINPPLIILRGIRVYGKRCFKIEYLADSEDILPEVNQLENCKAKFPANDCTYLLRS